jgi:hypothetical protein
MEEMVSMDLQTNSTSTHIPFTPVEPGMVHTQCPSCQKEYVVEAAKLNDDLALFKCVQCTTQFFFAVDQILHGRVASLVLDLPDFQLGHLNFVDSNKGAAASQMAADHGNATSPHDENNSAVDLGKTISGAIIVDRGGMELGRTSQTTLLTLSSQVLASRICPKCHASNSAKSENCEVCGVNFSKYEILKRDGGFLRNINKSLYDKWQGVLSHYDDLALHQEFVSLCVSKGQLSLAARCYSRVLDVFPGDEMAQARLKGLDGLAQLPLSSRQHAGADRAIRTWRKHAFAILFGVGGLLIAIGFFMPQSRNLVGAGVALLVVTYGLRMLILDGE